MNSVNNKNQDVIRDPANYNLHCVKNGTEDLKEVKRKVHEAIQDLFKNDKELLVHDANERSITHRLAVYLEKKFPKWNVDCEYNRDYEKTKTLMDLGEKSHRNDDSDGTSVFPDIIIHKRMTNDNLLVIEVKKTTNHKSDDFDMRKLDAFKEELGYKFCLFLRFVTGDQKPEVVKEEWK